MRSAGTPGPSSKTDVEQGEYGEDHFVGAAAGIEHERRGPAPCQHCQRPDLPSGSADDRDRADRVPAPHHQAPSPAKTNASATPSSTMTNSASAPSASSQSWARRVSATAVVRANQRLWFTSPPPPHEVAQHAARKLLLANEPNRARAGQPVAEVARCVGRREQDRCSRRPELVDDVETQPIGQMYVQDHDIRSQRSSCHQRLLGGASLTDDRPRTQQQSGDDRSELCVVINDQDAARHQGIIPDRCHRRLGASTDDGVGPCPDAERSLELIVRTMHRLAVPTLAVLALLLSSCGSDDAESSAVSPSTSIVRDATPATSAPQPATSTVPRPIGTEPPALTTAPIAPPSLIPFVDEFDDDRHGWAGPFQRFEDGLFVWDMPPGQSDTRAANTLIAVESELEALRVGTEFTAEGVDSVGLQCAYAEIGGSSQWYNLELATTGAVIRKRPLGDAPVETLASDNTVVLGTEPVTLEATCAASEGSYRLELAVDGEVVLVATDPDPFGPGAPGLVVRAAPDGPTTTHVVRFERFAVNAI